MGSVDTFNKATIMSSQERKMGEERMAELQGVFTSMDKNRNGVLSMAELEGVFNLMGITDNNTVKAIIAQWDQAGTGAVSFKDFVKIMETNDLDQESKEERDKKFIRNAFSAFDADNDGFITRNELENVLKQMGQVTEAEVTALMKEADTNNDDKIDIDEFVKVM